MQLVSGVTDPITVIGVDDKYDALGVLVIVAPQRSDLVAAANIPNSEGHALIVDVLDVEADGRYGSYNLTELELVQDCGLSRCIE